MNYYLEAFRRYADFSGRARRSEYWYFVLFNFIATFVIAFGAGVIAGMLSNDVRGAVAIADLYVLAALLPGLAVSVRRLHDTGRSGWWLLLCLVPLVNLILLFFYIEDSQPGTNEYGPNPKEVESLRSAF